MNNNYTYYRRYRPSQKRKSFKSFFWLVAVLVVLLLILRACVGVITHHKQEKRDEAILSINKGSAQLLSFGESRSKAAADSQILLEGDSVSTAGNSWVTLTFYNGTRVIMDSNTQLSYSHYDSVDFDDTVVLELLSGRVWLDPMPNEQGVFEVEVQSKSINVIASNGQGQALIANLDQGELVYSIEGQVALEFVERNAEDVVIEQILLGQGNKSILDAASREALLDRENISLFEPAGDDLANDPFVLWVNGEAGFLVSEPDLEEEPVVEEVETVEAEEETEPVSEVVPEVEGLKIAIDSPLNGSTIQKDAIAIEGRIVSGEASRVTVTWSGNGQPYELGQFAAGDGSFRYVADVDYANFAAGENTYTIKAYDTEGNVSNVITLVLNADF